MSKEAVVKRNVELRNERQVWEATVEHKLYKLRLKVVAYLTEKIREFKRRK